MTEQKLEAATVKLKQRQEKSKEKIPPLYKILLLNDDYTPMEFVIEVLMLFFSMNQEQATHVMLKVHTEGVGVCGVYTSDIASTKVNQVIDFAKRNQHPLKCVMEKN